MKDYENFDLLIERHGERCRARVLRSPAGESQPEEFASPFSRSDLETLFERARGSPRDVDVEPRGAPQPQSAFVEAGARLFEAVFIRSVRSRLDVSLEKTSKSGQGLRLRLRLAEPEFAKWPWEYLRDPRRDRWLAIQSQLSIVRYPELEEELQPLPVTAPLHVLVVEAAATGRLPLKAEPEWTGIERHLEEAVASGRVVLDRLPNATLPALRERLRSGKEHHVLHFIGHGGLDPGGDGVLFFAGEQGGRQEVSGRTLGHLLLNHPSMRLVVLNSCEGAREGREEAFSSVAEALVRSRVPAVVAMHVAVSDRAALSFARHFYRELAEGLPLDEVLSRTREGMLTEDHSVEWGTPALYLRSEHGQLFEMGKEEEIRPSWRAPVVAALLLLLVIGLWIVPFFWTKRGHREPQDPDYTRSTALKNAKSDPECPEPPGVHIPFRLIKPEKGKPFCMGMFEVTQEQWNKVMKEQKNPSIHLGPDRPMEGVTFALAEEFAKKLNQLDPSQPYRLPKDAEWDYAVHAGSSALYSFGMSASVLYRYGNCKRLGDHVERTAPVGRFSPNRLDLYDMHGNVWEWVSDGAHPGKRLKRGGAWSSSSKDCQSLARAEVDAEENRNDTGFRMAREPILVKK